MSLHHLKYVLLPKCCASAHGNIHTKGCYKLTRIKFLENSSYYKQMRWFGFLVVGILFEDTACFFTGILLLAPVFWAFLCLLPFICGRERGLKAGFHLPEVGWVCCVLQGLSGASGPWVQHLPA